MKHSSISGILTDDLFGLYSYRIGTYEDKDINIMDELTILYGDNGSGKTTILTIIYHLLSPEDNKGHKTALWKIPLNRFLVALHNGSEIGMTRSPGVTRGDYRVHVSRPGHSTVSCKAGANAAGHIRVPENAKDYKEWRSVIDALKSLDISIYYLPDHRRLESGDSRDQNIDLDLVDYDYVVDRNQYAQSGRRLSPTQSVLETAIDGFDRMAREDAIQAASVGEANINSIYLDIAKRVTGSGGIESAKNIDNYNHLINRIESLMNRNDLFYGLGFAPKLELGEIVDIIYKSGNEENSLLSKLINPYLDSVSARLDALEPTRSMVSEFVGTINSFYTNKWASFSLSRGLEIVQPNWEELNPNDLSSGEQQLLLLFCSTIKARSRSTIFIIDEPELSLNVKWQRKLMPALLRLVAGTGVQFVISTHSIEILSDVSDSVVRLNSPKYRLGAND